MKAQALKSERLNQRITPAFRHLLQSLAVELGIDVPAVITQAVTALAKQHGVPLAQTKPKKRSGA